MRGNDLGLVGAHLGGGCLDNSTDPGWCVWCGREILPPGEKPAGEAPAPAAWAPFIVPAAAVPAKPEPKSPAWYMRMARMRRVTGGGDR